MLMEPNVFQPEYGPDAQTDAAAAPSRHDYYPSHHVVDDIDEDDGEFRPALIDTTEYEHHQHQQQERQQQQQQRYRIPPPPPLAQRQITRNHRKPAAYDITTPSAQSFLPSFFRDTVPPLGHSRPYFSPPAVPPQLLQQQQHQQQQLGNSIGIRSAAAQSSTAPPTADQAILGSGDFGVIRGGTFYQENDPPVRALETNDYFHFFKNNGHGRPQAAALQQQQPPHGFGGGGGVEEQFANFRDFADINAPGDPAYSQFVVVYANKNASAAAQADDDATATDAVDDADDVDVTQAQPLARRLPQNIFEQLEALDREQPERYEVKMYKPLKPNSFKAKLAKTKLEKKYTKKSSGGSSSIGPKDTEFEPLMALS